MDVSEFYEVKDQKIVDGYIRSNYVTKRNMDTVIPKDIIGLINLFYHMVIRECFKHYNSDYNVVSNNDMMVARKNVNTETGWSVAYGALSIPSCDKGIYEWMFRITNSKDAMAIGIDDTTYNRIKEGGFANRNGESKCYALWSDGFKTRWDVSTLISPNVDSTEFNQNDLVTMTLDLSSKLISFKINDDDKIIAFEDVTTAADVNYCMAVCTGSSTDCVELVKCCYSPS